MQMENMSVQMSIDQQQSRQQQQQHSLSWWPIHHHHNQQHSPRPQKQFTLPSFKELCVFEDKGPGELQSLLHADFMCEDSKLFGGIDLCHANDNDQSTPSSSFTAPPEVSDDSSQVSLESSSPSSTCSSVPPPSLEPCFSPVSTVSPERVAACNPLLLIAPIKKAPKRPFNIHSQGPSHQCANCNAINSPLWRRHPDLAQSWLCNACGLYYKQYNSHRPFTEKKFKARVEIACGLTPPVSGNLFQDDALSGCGAPQKKRRLPKSGTCINCGPVVTPMWRRTENDELICNACGLCKCEHIIK